tara:strand:+ start:79872 stop:81530 length:1659 start_codon:yes stop_codon:yes gene_type:complete
MRYIIISLSILFLSSCRDISAYTKKATVNTKPKLVVGIVVDQMRYDYLKRFESKYSNDGFRKLMVDGFHCDEHHFSYMPTYTGPGHASIFTGSTPETNGIIANDWYNKKSGKMMYCAEDEAVKPVGVDSKNENRSPKNVLVTGLGDQIKISTSYVGKSIGVSLKDRAAIFPAGKLADGAYWFKGGEEGKFITSTYYMNELPSWVNSFNDQKKPDSYLGQNWETLLPIEKYIESNPDNNAYEQGLEEGVNPVFPYELNRLKETKGYSLIKSTPFGNDLLLDFAKAAIVGENLGQDSIMDWLTISFSSTDYIGHAFGPRSVEVEDTYLRLDQNIAELIMYLDKTVGKDAYVIFLTADHGAAIVPQELMDKGVEIGYYNDSIILAEIENSLKMKFGIDDLIQNYSNYQFFLDHKLIKENNLNFNEVCNSIVNVALKQPGVKSGMIRRDLERNQYTERVKQTVQKGWNHQRSGDVALVMEPGWIPNWYEKDGGTTHGSPWTYDTHVPLLFYGFGITSGFTNELTRVEDIVPTVAAVIGIQPPMGCTGVVIDAVLAK